MNEFVRACVHFAWTRLIFLTLPYRGIFFNLKKHRQSIIIGEQVLADVFIFLFNRFTSAGDVCDV